MGLAERRAAERFKNEDYPGWLAKIEQAARFPVPVEVAWDELAVADFADDYGDFFPKVYFQPLVDASTFEVMRLRVPMPAEPDGFPRWWVELGESS